MSRGRNAVKWLVPVLAPVVLTACTGEPEVSYSQDVQPVLEKHCLSCHQAGGAGHKASGLSMASYDDLMKGTDGGAMIIPGDVEGSNLVVLMEGRADPSISMPHGSLEKVPGAEVTVVKNWIAQGAKNN